MVNATTGIFGRHLILTDDERSWKMDRPVLFLGEWCRTHARRHVWKDMDAIVATPYGLNSEIRDADHELARTYEETLFPQLCSILNGYHATCHGERYWRMLLGHWFRRYIELMINRYNTLEICLGSYKPGSVTFLEKEYTLAPQNSYLSIRMVNDSQWNSALYSCLFKYVKSTDIAIEELAIYKPHTKLNLAIVKQSRLKIVRKFIVKFLKNLATFLFRDNDAVIISSYLPRWDDALLHIALGQFPQSLVTSDTNKYFTSANSAQRCQLSKILSPNLTHSLDCALRDMLFHLIPVCFLEGYKELSKSAAELPWPRNPKFIFTSNNFDTDEIFKAWAATKVEESRIPYIVGQHGGNYGTHRYMNPSVEEITSDKFITWGWVDGIPQHVVGFILKIGSKRKQQFDSRGGLLLIELHPAQMLTTWDGVSEYGEYFEEQKIFVSHLRDFIRQKLIIRLHHDHRDLDWDDIARWNEHEPSIKIDAGESRLSKLVAASRLVVHGYDSTGILETLAQNIPTMAFWQNGFSHLRDSAKPYYQMLVECGIVHLSPQSTSLHINSIWDDVGAWWYSPKVQDARLQFCERYARVSEFPVSELRDTLLGAALDSKRMNDIKYHDR